MTAPADEPASVDTPAPTRQLITTRAEYAHALDVLLARAQRSIRVFDPDLAATGLLRLARIEQLRALLGANRGNEVIIALRDPTHVLRSGARLTQLQQVFPERLRLYHTDGEAARAQDCFVLVDGRHFVRRAVAAQTRGVLALNEAREGRLLAERFEALLSRSEAVTTGTATGL